jgi:acyl carrier protein
MRCCIARSGAKASAVGSDTAVELETFLVDFVVDQTGYPQEIVELDADLEGDLGIDSIRKAQLFGEIGQRYGLSADSSVSLDDFRTLRHLLDYMLPRVGGKAEPVASPASLIWAALRSRCLPPGRSVWLALPISICGWKAAWLRRAWAGRPISPMAAFAICSMASH